VRTTRSRFVDLPSDLSAVETPSERELPRERLAACGLDASKIETIWERVRRLYETGTQPAIALAIRHRGELVLERAIGYAREGVLASPRTPFCTFSVSKAVSATLMHLLDEEDCLRLDDPVCEYIPEFARHGKDWVTIRHVLTHRAGIPSVAGDREGLELLTDPKAIIASLCDAKPVFLPGRRLAYHAVTGGFILDEIARRVTGHGLDVLLRDRVAGPLRCEYLSFGLPAEAHHFVADNRHTGYGVPFPFSRLIKKALGLPMAEAVEASNDPRWLNAVVPSGNLMATADDLARFFLMLMRGGELDGERILEARTVRRLLVESAYLEPDLTLGLAVRYGQGVMLGSYPVSLFGPHTSRAFGHYGLVNIVAYGDPERDISVGLLTSGKAIIANQLGAFMGLLGAISRGFPRSA
jgi:CubicO group peptidase (beta-lactamase class C family)